MWFTSRMEVTSTELCFYYISGEGKHSSVAPHMQLKIFSLRYLLYLYIAPLTIYSSLSVDPCGSLHVMLYEPATGYSNILHLITEPELGFYNGLIIYKTTNN